MPLLNVEAGYEFPELIEFRDRRAKEVGATLIVRTVDKAIARQRTCLQPTTLTATAAIVTLGRH